MQYRTITRRDGSREEWEYSDDGKFGCMVSQTFPPATVALIKAQLHLKDRLAAGDYGVLLNPLLMAVPRDETR